MTTPASRDNNNSKCPPKVPMDFTVDEALAKEIAADAIVLPLFEKGLFEHAYKKHYSLMRNEHLKCAWAEYKNHSDTRVVAPFQFPDQRDIHFYKSTIKFIPSETNFKRANFRKTLKPGPGVDYGGQMPIPQELLMKRNITNKDKKEEKEQKKRIRSKTAKGSKTSSSKDKNENKEKKK